MFTISVVSTGSKLVASGDVGPEVRAQLMDDKARLKRKTNIKKTEINRVVNLFRIICLG
jgi:hypothetical protein